MAIVTGDRYLERLVKFVEQQADLLIEGTLVLKLNPVGLHYVQSRLEALQELERLIAGAPVDYLRAYISDLGDHRALDKLRRILCLLTSLKVVSVLPPPVRDPTPLSLLPFSRLKVLELRGCDLSTSEPRGLFELRHTLEKLICHNSTDALRHVFASRIADIKKSPHWTRLSFVSCARNGLVLMDESLQLLPAAEILDLSRNKFSKVDNLRRCTKMKHLDLGFNHLREVKAFCEVPHHIVKLVLRNNALTTLRGIENLKSLEGLDVSYNIISKFSEVEYLAGIPCLQSLWLEGNPLCCSRWYRAQVFSFFTHAERLKLDDKEMSTIDFWEREIIIVHRQKKPASYGFYSPAKYGAEEDACINRKTKRASRLALIEGEEESTYLCSDQDSVSCDHEVQSREEKIASDDEAEIVELINRVEFLKKERSVLWLRELKEWMDHPSDDFVNGCKCSQDSMHLGKENHTKSKRRQGHAGESSKFVSDSAQASVDYSSTKNLDSGGSFVDIHSGLPAFQHSEHIGSLNKSRRVDLKHRHLKALALEGFSNVLSQTNDMHSDGLTIQTGDAVAKNALVSPLTTIDDISGSHSPPACRSSPPHYQEDLLHRRLSLVEEILQLSAESFSLASSGSDSSSSEDCFVECGSSLSEVDQTLVDLPVSSSDGEESVDLEADSLEKRKRKRKAKRRVISLLDENDTVSNRKASQMKSSLCKANVEDNKGIQLVDRSNCQEVGKLTQKSRSMSALIDIDNEDARYLRVETSSPGSNDIIEKYFNKNVADAESQENCRLYIRCICVLEPESVYREREVALLLSSKDRLYMLHIGVALDGSGKILTVIGCHRIGHVREILVGLGLQVVRIYIEEGSSYLFITRSIEKSRQLLQMLQESDATDDKCSFTSLEQVQVQLFVKQVCEDSEVCIYQYSMVLFWWCSNKEELWAPRSLFVVGGYVFVCDEDLMQFSPHLKHASLSLYLDLDTCCSIADITDLVIEAKRNLCVTVSLNRLTSEFMTSKAGKKIAVSHKQKQALESLTWKVKWFSKEGLFNFVSLVKAIREATTTSPMLIRCKS